MAEQNLPIDFSNHSLTTIETASGLTIAAATFDRLTGVAGLTIASMQHYRTDIERPFIFEYHSNDTQPSCIPHGSVLGCTVFSLDVYRRTVLRHSATHTFTPDEGAKAVLAEDLGDLLNSGPEQDVFGSDDRSLRARQAAAAVLKIHKIYEANPAATEAFIQIDLLPGHLAVEPGRP